jgi:hypothetical protein
MMRKAMLWGAAVAITMGSSAGVANVVVVTLPESAKINLQGGDVVTVIGPASAQTLRGPGNFDAKQVALSAAAGQRGRFGALRATDVAHNPSIWDVDASQSGKVCVSDASKLQLWRPDKEAAVTVKIHDADGKSQELNWAAGTALAAWPAALPVKSGAEYQVEWPEGDSSKLELVTIVPPPPQDLVGAAQVLVEHGCQKQLDLLVDSASKPAPAK